MSKMTRRDILKAGVLSTGLLSQKPVRGAASPWTSLRLASSEKDHAPIDGKPRSCIPTACDQCFSRDGILAYVEDGRVVKLEGNPDLPRTRGKLCSKGQAGILQIYHPDRLLHPLKRVGKRGEGRWTRISWEEAIREIVTKLDRIQKSGQPEELCFLNGRMKGSAGVVLKDYILRGFGTKTYCDHTSLCGSGRWVAQNLMWGKQYPNDDILNTDFILNFGSNFMECHTNHIPLSQRIAEVRATRQVPMITFDVRLSNSAAYSDEWIPIKPGTDGAVALAMSHVIMMEKLYNRIFIETWTNVTVDQLTKHLKHYTPEWAESISGVKASRIQELAIQFARARSGVCLEYKGAVAHYGGHETERAIMMLVAICGYINCKGGRCSQVKAHWHNSYPLPPKNPKKLDLVDGYDEVAFPLHQVASQVFRNLKEGTKGKPKAIFTWMFNPAYILFDNQTVIDVLKDEELVPYLVVSDVCYNETAALADLILPDTVYLEKWDWEHMVSMDGIEEFYIRQPVVPPPAEVRDFRDVFLEVASRLGMDLGFATMEQFVRDACEHTPGVREAGGFENMKKNGVWYDRRASIEYEMHAKPIPPVELNHPDILFDESTGVYWNWTQSSAIDLDQALQTGYTHTEDAWRGYRGQKVGNRVVRGFPPFKANKSGLLEIYSNLLESKGYDPLPTYQPFREHENMKPNELILTSFRINVQGNSRTQHCKWLTELAHDNPAWINPETARVRGIQNGDRIEVTSRIGKIVTTARVTEGVHPLVIAISFHCGHWRSGYYASGNKGPEFEIGYLDESEGKWWREKGEHPNWIIPDSVDPISGQHCMNDTVVTVSKVANSI